MREPVCGEDAPRLPRLSMFRPERRMFGSCTTTTLHRQWILYQGEGLLESCPVWSRENVGSTPTTLTCYGRL